MDGIVEIVYALTGLGLVRLLSLGKRCGEKLTGNEAAINSAAGSLSFLVDGRRVIAAAELILVGIVFLEPLWRSSSSWRRARKSQSGHKQTFHRIIQRAP